MAFALGGEGRCDPVLCTALELHPGELRHEIELTGPDIAVVVCPTAVGSVGLSGEVVRARLLTHQVVGVEAQVFVGDVERHGNLTWR